MALQATHGQRRIWAAHYSARLPHSELVPWVYRLEGVVDVARLERALAAAVDSHEALRTSLVAREGEVWQEPIAAWAASTFRLEVAAAEGGGATGVGAGGEGVESVAAVGGAAAGAGGERGWQGIAVAFLQRGFALERDVLLKGLLIRLGPERHVLVLAVHHSAMDGVSIGVLQACISDAYREDRAERCGAATSFADYSRWTMEREAAGELADGVSWHLARLPSIDDEGLGVEPERRRGSVACRPAFVRYPIAADVHAAIAAASQQQWALGPGEIYLAALFAFLAAYTGRGHVVVGCLVPNRLRPCDRETVGFFVNIVPMALTVNWRDRCAEYLTLAHRVIFQSLKRQDVPYGLLLREWSGDPYRFDQTPFDALFTYRPALRTPLMLDGCRVTSIEPPWWPLPFELMVDFDEEADRCTGLVRWDAALFGEGIARTLRLGFSEVLRQLVMSPEAPLSGIRERVRAVMAGAGAESAAQAAVGAQAATGAGAGGRG